MAKLIDICDIQYGYAFDSGCFTDDNSFPPLVRIRDVKRGFSETYYNGEYPADYVLNAGDLLVGMDGEFSIARWKVDGALLNQRVCKIIARPDTDEEYLRFALGKALKTIEDRTSFVTVKHLSAKELNKLELDMPTYEEQVHRSTVLSKLETVIEQRLYELDKLDELIKARFVELFGTVDNNVFDYPVVRLGDYAKLQGGYAFKSKDFVDEGIPLVQIGNVNKDYLDWEVINAVPEEYLDRYREFSLCDGDLVMAMTRPIIKSINSVKIAKVCNSDVPCLLNQRVGRFVLSDLLDKLFLETLCKSDDFKDYVERMSGNSLQPNISSKQVEDYRIILPPIDLQERFAEFVKQVDKSKVVSLEFSNI